MTISKEQIATSIPSSPEEQSQLASSPETLLADPANEDVDLNTLNKIRDLLFGQQVQKHEQRLNQLGNQLVQECAELRSQHEQRLNQLGNRLDQECAELRSQIDRRLESLETTLKKELKTLTKTVQNNHDVQTSAVSDLQSELQEEYQTGLSAVKVQIEQMEDTFSQKHDELKALLEREVQELNASDDTDRANLADLFSELALNIRDSR